LKALVNLEDRVLCITRKLFVDARNVIAPDTNPVCRLRMSSASFILVDTLSGFLEHNHFFFIFPNNCGLDERYI
jgi:hypothetical protein